MKIKNYKLISRTKQGLFALAFTCISGITYSQATYTLSYTGSVQTLALPIGTYSIQCWGADGGEGGGTTLPYTGLGGVGGYSGGVYTANAPTTLYIYVGGKGQATNAAGAAMVTAAGGWNGGGGGFSGSTNSYYKGGGGGGTDVRTTNNNTYANRVIVAGGGGGAGGGGSVGFIGFGGAGGGTLGQDGVLGGSQVNHNGKGGTQAAGGTGGIYSSSIGANGTFGIGGDGGSVSGNTFPAGGGGGGWYGGGGGSTQGGSGGGGSSYIGGVTSASTFTVSQAGFLTNPDLAGNGRVVIRELCAMTLYSSGSNSLSPMLCSGQSATLMTNAVSNFSWSTGATSSSIVVSPTSNTVYSVTALTASNCTTSRSISVSVSAGIPVLAIANPSNNICLGRTVSLTATGALTYTWANAGVVNGQTFTPSSTAAYTVFGQNGCGTSSAVTTISVAPLPVTASASPSLVCEGYPATLTGVSAINAYTWMPGSQTGSVITVAPAATTVYTVTTSDGICSGTQTLLLTTKTTPSIVTSQTLSNICLGQSVNLFASGAGTGGTYSWTPGGSGSSIVLAPSTSTSVIVAGTNSLNCTATALQIILVNQPPVTAATANKFAVCAGDPVILTASGAPIYQWANGPATANFTVNPTVSTVYTVTGSHNTNTCTIDVTVSINAIVPNVTLASSVAVCEGGSVAIVATGASLYKWNGGLNSTSGAYVTTPAVSSVFTLVATTSSFNVNCLTTHFTTLTLNQNPTITITPAKQTICKGETHTLTATGASSYSWSASASTGSVITVKPTTSVFYTVTGVDAKGCESTIIYNAKVNNCNGIEERAKQNLLSVYPNPNNGQFFVSAESTMTLNVINALGQLIQTIELNTENGFNVEVSGLAKGVYYLSSAKDTQAATPTKLIVN